LEKETPQELINIRDDPRFGRLRDRWRLRHDCDLLVARRNRSETPSFPKRAGVVVAVTIRPGGAGGDSTNPQFAEVEGQMEFGQEPGGSTANAPLAGGFVLEKPLKSAAKVAAYDSSAARALIDPRIVTAEFVRRTGNSIPQATITSSRIRF
jgi:hypothetical protein